MVFTLSTPFPAEHCGKELSASPSWCKSKGQPLPALSGETKASAPAGRSQEEVGLRCQLTTTLPFTPPRRAAPHEMASSTVCWTNQSFHSSFPFGIHVCPTGPQRSWPRLLLEVVVRLGRQFCVPVDLAGWLHGLWCQLESQLPLVFSLQLFRK